MSRGAIILIIILLAVAGALWWLSSADTGVPPQRIEKAITLNESAK